MISDNLSCMHNNYQAAAIDYPLYFPKQKNIVQKLYEAISSPTWHKTADQINLDQITISSTLLAQLTDDNCINLTMKGVPLASLNHNFTRVTNDCNQGPYMDIFSYSLRPVTNENACIPLFDSAGGTPLEKTLQITQENRSLGFNISANNPTINAALAKSTSYQTPETTFQQKEYVHGKKRTLIYSLNKCKDGNNFVPYDIEKISTLRTNEWDLRLTCSLFTPPANATSAFNAEWTVKYYLPVHDQDKIQFEWTTEVRIVVASLEKQIFDHNDDNDIEDFSWIKTAHQTIQLFEVHINKTQKKLSIQLISKNVRRITSYGYRERDSYAYYEKKWLIDNEGKSSLISKEEACKKFNIPT